MAIEYDIKELKDLIANKNVQKIKEFMDKNDLYLNDEGRIVPKDVEYFKAKANFWDLKQYVKKIQLNSSYGSLLNNNSVFYDFRLGSSITLTGRNVWKHLASETNYQMMGEYKHTGGCIVTGDTDSVYMSIDTDEFKKVHPDFDYSKDNVVKYADEIGEIVNNTFTQHMMKITHCTEDGAKLQASDREVVASRGLICGKKRYALMVYEKDGYRQDVGGKPGKAKIMGIQVSRSDCPLIIRNLLKKMLESVLTVGTKEALVNILKSFGENDWDKLNAWEKGSPRTCNKLTQYTEEYKRTKKCSVGQVMASINWNMMVDMMDDKRSPKILDGNKVIVCKLKSNNPMGMKSIAYPMEITQLPSWFKKLPFAEQDMEDSVVDRTIETVFGVLGWKLTLKDIINEDNDDLNNILTFC